MDRSFRVELKNRAAAAIGGIALAIVGRPKFYGWTQSKSRVLRSISNRFCWSDVRLLVRDFDVQQRDKDRRRISDAVLEKYSTDDLHGYASVNFKDGAYGEDVTKQQRGRIIPLMEKIIAAAGTHPYVVEIGTGNGDVLAHLARKFPDASFIGLDLSIVNAAKKHVLQNVAFEKAYALDHFQGGAMNGRCDIVFGSNTFCCFVPGELEDTLAAVKNAGAKTLAFGEPIVGAFQPSNDGAARSDHMHVYMWGHNYAGYLRRLGYAVTHYEVQRDFAPDEPSRRFNIVAGTL